MAIPKLLGAQRDFSAGELDKSTKRADENPIVKDGGRQMLNWRILNSKTIQNRSGRSALFLAHGRVEEISVKSTVFFIGFDNASVSIYNAAGAQVFTSAVRGDGSAIPWVTSTLGGIVYAIIGLSIYIAYPDGAPNNVPQVLSWDGVSTWAINNYVESVNGPQKRTAFYRISPQNITLLPSATSGNITIVFSQNVLTAGMIGTRLRYADKQLTITGVTDGMHGTATVNETLPPAQQLTLGSSSEGSFNIGDVVKGSVSGATGIVTGAPTSQSIGFNQFGGFGWSNGQSVTGLTSGATGTVTSTYWNPNGTGGGDNAAITVLLSTSTLFTAGENFTNGSVTNHANHVSTSGAPLTVQIIPTQSGNVPLFTTSDTVVGPSGSANVTAVSTITPQAISDWDNEVINAFQGYPFSVFADQGRLGFTHVPAVQGAIIWSSIGVYTDLYTDALPGDSIFEIAPDQSIVLFVVPGMESSEFVFTDRAIYYIPISPSFPLEPGNVAFNKLSDYGIFPSVQPRRAEQSIIYVKSGATMIGAVQAPGAYYRPYIVDAVSELHSHLFTGLDPVAIAIPSGPAQFSELYIYIALAGGGLVVGRYNMRQGLIEPGAEGKPAIGWLPWNGAGLVEWVAARQNDVIFTTLYSGVSVVEQLDDTQYVDGALLVNNLPAPFAPPPGKGPLYKFPGPNTTVFLIDLGSRFMGDYQVDANGFLIPQFIGGENLASPQLVAGQSWTAIFEPWTPEAPPGQSQRQRLLRRRISYLAVRVTDSTGFVLARLFSGPLRPGGPALGQVMNTRRIATWNLGDDPTQPPPLREETQRWRPIGRSFDPRVAIIKDTPGSILINEVGMEVTI